MTMKCFFLFWNGPKHLLATAYGSGYIVNFGDVLPAFSSILFGISTAIATVGALIANLIAGLVIKEATLSDWRKLFILFSVVYVIGGVIFLAWGSATPRSWAKHKEQQEPTDTTTTVGEEMTPMKAVDWIGEWRNSEQFSVLLVE